MNALPFQIYAVLAFNMKGWKKCDTPERGASEEGNAACTGMQHKAGGQGGMLHTGTGPDQRNLTCA